mmetsp:Transcript_25676/g.42994  ORF Transcript_25676/g.42994 Transcript_25676/m.42994 type:complete len:149 (-) Transcript_25676:429-875(-)
MLRTICSRSSALAIGAMSSSVSNASTMFSASAVGSMLTVQRLLPSGISSATQQVRSFAASPFDDDDQLENKQAHVYMDVSNNNTELALRKLKRQLITEGIAKQLKGKKFHLRPAAQRVLDNEEKERRHWKKGLKRKLQWIMSRRERGF